MSSSTVIANNEDLLTEILLRLPVKPLFRFRCVSKFWHHLITNPQFHDRKITGLIAIRRKWPKLEYDVVTLDKTGEIPSGFVHEDHIKILQYCNGLFLCRTGEGNFDYYVCDPSVNEFRELPSPMHEEFSVKSGVEVNIHGIYLAFDPRKSPHYKVLCLYTYTSVMQNYEMEIYSSDTGWRCRRGSFSTSLNFRNGIYWNGAINFLWNGSIYCSSMYKGIGMYFDVDEERFKDLPKRPAPQGSTSIDMYFGVSHDRLLFIEMSDARATQLNLYEMDKEYSGWLLRYHIDTDVVTHSLVNQRPTYHVQFSIVSVVWSGNEKDSFVVLNLHGKAVRYNLGDKSLKKIWNFTASESDGLSSFPPVLGLLILSILLSVCLMSESFLFCFFGFLVEQMSCDLCNSVLNYFS